MRVRAYVVLRAVAQVMVLWTVLVVIATPLEPVPSTRELQRACLRVTRYAACAGAMVAVCLAWRERRRSIRKHLAFSVAAYIITALVTILGFPIPGLRL